MCVSGLSSGASRGQKQEPAPAVCKRFEVSKSHAGEVEIKVFGQDVVQGGAAAQAEMWCTQMPVAGYLVSSQCVGSLVEPHWHLFLRVCVCVYQTLTLE